MPKGSNVISQNRKAFRDFEIMERFEAGIVLLGTEIKSIRAAKINLQEAYARPHNGELWLYGMHIASWTGGGPWNHEPLRPKKLLLHQREIRNLTRSAGQKGLTIVPLKCFMKNHVAKIELGLARGRRKYDKRQVIIRRETEREIARALRHRN